MMKEILDEIIDTDPFLTLWCTAETVRYVHAEWDRHHAVPIDDGQLRLFLCDESYGELTEEQKLFIRQRRGDIRYCVGKTLFRILLYREMLRSGMDPNTGEAPNTGVSVSCALCADFADRVGRLPAGRRLSRFRRFFHRPKSKQDKAMASYRRHAAHNCPQCGQFQTLHPDIKNKRKNMI